MRRDGRTRKTRASPSLSNSSPSGVLSRSNGSHPGGRSPSALPTRGHQPGGAGQHSPYGNGGLAKSTRQSSTPKIERAQYNLIYGDLRSVYKGNSYWMSSLRR